MKLFDYQGISPQVDESCFVASGAKIIGDVLLKRNVSVWFNVVIRGDSGSIVVGENSNVQDNSTLHTDKGLPCVIGKNVTIGHNAVVHACTVEDNCLIGMGATVLSGSVIGKNSVIAAGAVLGERKVVPEGSLYAGVPARFIRNLTDDEKNALIKSADNYLKYAKAYR